MQKLLRVSKHNRLIGLKDDSLVLAEDLIGLWYSAGLLENT